MTYVFYILTMIGQFLPPILACNLILGRAKILHFGAIGTAIVVSYAFVLMWLATGSFLLGIAFALVLSLLLSALFAVLSLRLEADAFGVMTLAVYLAIIALAQNWISLTGGPYGITPIPRLGILRDPGVFAAVSMFIGIAFAVLTWFVDRSRLGRSLQAFAEHPWCAVSLGLSRFRAVMLAFLFAGLGPVLSNPLYLQFTGILHPSDFLFPTLVFELTCIVAGGPGSVVGVSIATALMVILKEALRFLPLPVGLVGPLRLLLFGAILLIAIFVRRKELFPQPRTV